MSLYTFTKQEEGGFMWGVCEYNEGFIYWCGPGKYDTEGEAIEIGKEVINFVETYGYFPDFMIPVPAEPRSVI